MKSFVSKGSLVFLCVAENAIGAVNTDGTGYRRLLARECMCPDGLALDLTQYHKTKSLDDVHLFWTNMGVPKPDPSEKDGGDWHSPDGFLSTATLLGGDASAKRLPVRAPAHLVNQRGEAVKGRFPADGVFFTTLKQMTLTKDGRNIFACDREGHSVKKYNRDTQEVVPLLFSDDIAQLKSVSNKTSKGDDDKMHYCVGVALDEAHNHLFFTLKGPTHGGSGRIYAAPYNFATRNVPAKAGIPAGAEGVIDPDTIVCLEQNLPEPIDLLLDSKGGFLYWTDRGEPSLGGCSLNRAALTYKNGVPSVGKMETIITGFSDAIGVAWAGEEEEVLGSAEARRYMYVTDTVGHVYRCDLKERTKECIYKGPKGITGIDYIPQHLPA